MKTVPVEFKTTTVKRFNLVPGDKFRIPKLEDDVVFTAILVNDAFIPNDHWYHTRSDKENYVGWLEEDEDVIPVSYADGRPVDSNVSLPDGRYIASYHKNESSSKMLIFVQDSRCVSWIDLDRFYEGGTEIQWNVPLKDAVKHYHNWRRIVP